MTTYAIIDDEPIAHRIIEGYCEELSHLKKVGNAYNVFEATEILSQENVDLVFLDINMPKMTGFEWLKTVSNLPKIIVTSAHKEYALEGYELDIVDYLLKPFSLARFLKAINKIDESKHTESAKVPIQSTELGHFFLKGDKQYHQVHVNSILFIEALGNYTKVHLTDEIIVSHEKISSLEELLPSNKFLRVHKSFIVALDKIDIIQGNQICIREQKVPVGQTFKVRVNELLNGMR